MFKQQKLRDYTDRHGSSLLRYKYTVLTPLGETAAISAKVLSLTSTLDAVNKLLSLSTPLSYDRVRREMVRDGVSTSVVTVKDYAGFKGERKLIVLIAST